MASVARVSKPLFERAEGSLGQRAREGLGRRPWRELKVRDAWSGLEVCIGEDKRSIM